MRHDHLGLAVQLEEYYKVYKVPYPEEVDAWVTDTFHTFPSMTAEAVQKHHLLAESNPHLYWLPQTRELLIVGQHCYFDARTFWVFWGKLLNLVVNPRIAEHGSPGDIALSFHNFDARSWFPKDVDIDSLTIGTDLHSVLPFNLDIGSGSFKGSVGATDDNFKGLRNMFAKDYLGLDAINQLFKAFFLPGMPISTFPNFSSLGVAERFLRSSFGDPLCRSITIKDTYTVNHSMLEGMSCVSIWTWRERFQIAVTFNEAYHTEMFLRLMKDSCDTMLTGL
ncbi:hypothetical protein C8A03DRAFT_36700, partial [Achaetomium macrosporum]